MNKAELINEVHRLLGEGTSKAAAERAADSVLCAIKKGLKKDAEVHLVGFGTFSVAQRSARQGFNPHTRKPMRIPAMRWYDSRPARAFALSVEEMKEALIARFHAAHGRGPEIIAPRPGRIEFIGNHTDYNGGPVLGAAINRGVWVGLARRDDGQRRFASDARPASSSFARTLWRGFPARSPG